MLETVPVKYTNYLHDYDSTGTTLLLLLFFLFCFVFCCVFFFRVAKSVYCGVTQLSVRKWSTKMCRALSIHLFVICLQLYLVNKMTDKG